MLRQLRQKASETLSTARQVVLSTWGPADIQAESVSCESVGLALYVLVPRTSDLLFNLESNSLVIATAETWQARGMMRLLRPSQCPRQLAMLRAPEAVWCEVVEFRPTRLQLRPAGSRGQAETIDIV